MQKHHHSNALCEREIHNLYKYSPFFTTGCRSLLMNYGRKYTTGVAFHRLAPMLVINLTLFTQTFRTLTWCLFQNMPIVWIHLSYPCPRIYIYICNNVDENFNFAKAKTNSNYIHIPPSSLNIIKSYPRFEK